MKRSQVVRHAKATLESKSGSKVKGTLHLEDHYGGIIISGKVTGLRKNAKHAFHIHEVGDCSAADASSAGDHFASSGQHHGAPGDEHAHHGDLGNIKSDAKGHGIVNVYVKGLHVGAGKKGVRGRSIIIHHGEDDLKSQPTGNSGKRIACGVIEEVACCGSKP